MIRDRILLGIGSQKMRKLINEGNKLTLEKCVQICQSVEYAQEQLFEMQLFEMQSHSTTLSVNAVGVRGQKGASETNVKVVGIARTRFNP
ncbi:hypothetical protein ACF0H5_013182 [Mactra antiquata]